MPSALDVDHQPPRGGRRKRHMAGYVPLPSYRFLTLANLRETLGVNLRLVLFDVLCQIVRLPATRKLFYFTLFGAAEDIVDFIITLESRGSTYGLNERDRVRVTELLLSLLDTLERMANVVEWFSGRKYRIT